jgi:hypothetical protein
MNKMDEIEAIKMPPLATFTKSPAFPGLIKIGKTEDFAKRLTQLNTACAPAPHGSSHVKQG